MVNAIVDWLREKRKRLSLLANDAVQMGTYSELALSDASSASYTPPCNHQDQHIPARAFDFDIIRKVSIDTLDEPKV